MPEDSNKDLDINGGGTGEAVQPALIVRTTTLPFEGNAQPTTSIADDGTASIKWPFVSSASYEIGKLLTGNIADATYVKPGARVSLYGESSDDLENNPNFGYIYDASKPGTILWSAPGLQYSVPVGINLDDARILENLMQRTNADGQPAWLMEPTPDGMFVGSMLSMSPQDFAERGLNANISEIQVERAFEQWKNHAQQFVDSNHSDHSPNAESVIIAVDNEEAVKAYLREELEQQPYKENILKRGLQTLYWAHWLEKNEGTEPQRTDFPELSDTQFTQLKDNFESLNMPTRRGERGNKREEGKFTRRAYGLTYDFDIERDLRIDKIKFSHHAAALSAVYLHHMMDGSPDKVFELPIDQMAGVAKFADYEKGLFRGKSSITLQVPRHRSNIEIGGIEKISNMQEPGFNHVAVHVDESHLQAIFIRPDGPGADVIELQKQALLAQSAIYDITEGRVRAPIKLLSESGQTTDFTPSHEQVEELLNNSSPELIKHVSARAADIQKSQGAALQTQQFQQQQARPQPSQEEVERQRSQRLAATPYASHQITPRFAIAPVKEIDAELRAFFEQTQAQYDVKMTPEISAKYEETMRGLNQEIADGKSSVLVVREGNKIVASLVVLSEQSTVASKLPTIYDNLGIPAEQRPAIADGTKVMQLEQFYLDKTKFQGTENVPALKKLMRVVGEEVQQRIATKPDVFLVHTPTEGLARMVGRLLPADVQTHRTDYQRHDMPPPDGSEPLQEKLLIVSLNPEKHDISSLEASIKTNLTSVDSPSSVAPDLATRQAAIERIQYLTEELQKRGISVMMRGELEFFPLNEQGKPEARLIDEQKLTEQLRKTVPTIDRVHHEIASSQAQYEMVTGPNPEMPASGIEIDAPLRAAETMAAFKKAMTANAAQLGLGGVSFDARNQVGNTHENSGMHINISLWDKDGSQNLFYEQGSPTTDLQRHVIDAMIHMHANAAPAYFPTDASFDRIRSTSQTNIGNVQSIEDTASGVPNTAGYMPNKGMTVGSVAQKAVSALTGNKVEIGSVTSRYSDAEAMLFGAGEKILFNGVRSSAIGWEKPEQYRIESRLAGADADPYMVIAAELAAIHEAVTKHTRPFDPAKPINPETEKVITVGDTQMVVDKHNGKFASIPLAMDMETARARMANDATVKDAFGEKLVQGVLTNSKPLSSSKATAQETVPIPDYDKLLYNDHRDIFNHALFAAANRDTPEILKLKEYVYTKIGKSQVYGMGGLGNTEWITPFEYDHYSKDGEFHLKINSSKAREIGIDPIRLQKELPIVLNIAFGANPTIQNSDTRLNIKTPAQEFTYEKLADVFHGLNTSLSSAVREVMNKVNKDTYLNNAVLENPSARWAILTNQQVDVAGDYFPAQNLVEHNYKFTWPLHWHHTYEQRQDLFKKTAEYLDQEHGIKRLKYLGQGSYSTVFETVPDQEGRMQLVAISTPSGVEDIPHPAILPDRHVQMIETSNGPMQIRISAKFSQSDTTYEDVKNLVKVAQDSGLNPWDVDAKGDSNRNVASAVTSDGKRHVFIIDRGSVSWIGTPTEEEKQALIKQWENDPKLKPYYDALKELNAPTKVESTISKSLRDELSKLPESSGLKQSYEAKGMYPEEIAAASEDALKRAEMDGSNGANWHKYFKENIASFDPSVAPADAKKFFESKSNKRDKEEQTASVTAPSEETVANTAAEPAAANAAGGAPKENSGGTAQNNESNPSTNQSVETAALLATQLKSDTDKKSNEISDKIKQALETAESPVRHPEARGKSSTLLGTPEHRPNTVDFKMKGVGAAGLANRMNAIKEGQMGADEAAAQGTAILADTIDVASDMRLGDKLKAVTNAGANTRFGKALSKLNISTSLGNKMGWVGNALGIAADSYSGYKQGGASEAAYQGSKSTLNTGVALAVFLDQGKNLAGKGPAVGGVAGFAGKMGLINSFSTAAGDAMDYASGRKELNLDTYSETSLNTVVNLDPLKAVTSLAGATKLVGVDTGIQNISISSIVDKGLGTVGLTEGKGEQIGDVVAETMSIYNTEKERFRAGEIDPSLRRNGSSPIPSMTDYKHLGVLRHQIARYIPDGKIDGHDVSREFDQIDMTKMENYMAYKMGINRMMVEQEKIKIANHSYIPRWVRYGKKAEEYNKAESQLNLLGAAEKEFAMFENKMIKYKRGQEALVAEKQRYETAFKDAIASLDKNKDGNIGVDELNIAKNGASATTLDQEDLKQLRAQLGKYGNDVAANLEQALLDSGVKFDGSTQLAVAAPQTPSAKPNEDHLAAK